MDLLSELSLQEVLHPFLLSKVWVSSKMAAAALDRQQDPHPGCRRRSWLFACHSRTWLDLAFDRHLKSSLNPGSAEDLKSVFSVRRGNLAPEKGLQSI